MRVVIESPFAGETPEEREENIRYARAAMRDCLMRGEAPFASHLLYTQDGVLDDDDPIDRSMGIAAGLQWHHVADKVVVYVDRGISPGMEQGIQHAIRSGRRIEHRSLVILAEPAPVDHDAHDAGVRAMGGSYGQD